MLLQPAFKYFSTNCQIAGHSIEMYFKIHGYPLRFQAKQRKIATFAHKTTYYILSEQQGIDNDSFHTITTYQYTQLLALHY